MTDKLKIFKDNFERRKNNSENLIDYGKLPPQSKELEEAVLGAIIVDSKGIQDVINILNADCFYFPQYALIYGVCAELYHESQPIDSLTVTQKLSAKGQLESAGGAMQIINLCNQIGSSAHIESHALILKEKYISRKLIEIQQKSIAKCYEDTTDVFNELNNLITEIDKISSQINKLSSVSFSDQVANRIHELKEAATHNYKTGIESGLNNLDRVTLGFQPSDLIVLAARPAMGKTALALDMARKQALKGVPVGVFSLEMATSQLIDRLFSAHTGIDLKQIRKGGLQREQWQRLDDATNQIMDFNMFVCDKGGLNVNEIVSIAKAWKLKHGIKIIYIDYLQLINGTGTNKSANREQEISETSRKLKSLAKELNVPIIALSQLSRKCEERGDKRPMLSDLRESGAIEQDADMVIFPFRPSYYDENADAELCEVIIAKYRNGEIGKIDIRFQKEIQKFSDYEQFF